MQRAHAGSVSLPSVPGVSCHVAAMRAFLAIRPSSLTSACSLFYSRNLHGPVDAKQANCYLRGLLSFTGVPDALSYSSHAFRIGAASAAKPGASLAELQALGRWHSNRDGLQYVSAEVGLVLASKARTLLAPAVSG